MDNDLIMHRDYRLSWLLSLWLVCVSVLWGTAVFLSASWLGNVLADRWGMRGIAADAAEIAIAVAGMIVLTAPLRNRLRTIVAVSAGLVGGAIFKTATSVGGVLAAMHGDGASALPYEIGTAAIAVFGVAAAMRGLQRIDRAIAVALNDR